MGEEPGRDFSMMRLKAEWLPYEEKLVD